MKYWQIAETIESLQDDVYERHNANCAPNDRKEYNEWVKWIEDQIRKSPYINMLTYSVVDYLDDIDADMVAQAVHNILTERK